VTFNGFKDKKPAQATITEAINFAREKHKGQLDDEGKDYFDAHCAKVAEIIRIVRPDDHELIMAAYLHDVLEDTDADHMQLAKFFGQRVAGLVLEVTKEGSPNGDYFPRLKSKDGILLKFADRASNISRMSAWDKKRQDHYLKKSKFWRGRGEV
jgi:(p)ppGpp synthase/HD superfamily hydrolase